MDWHRLRLPVMILMLLALHSGCLNSYAGAATVAFAVNSGGPQYSSPSSGIVYQADTDYSGGAIASTTATITGTSDPTLYQTERYGNFAYNIPLANGSYTVTLKFAEIYWNTAGKRVFNVSMQGTQVISKLDIYAAAGKNVAYDVPVSVSVTTGTLNITFTSVVDYAKVSAIQITQLPTACTANAPTVSVTPSSQMISSGGSDTYAISVTNNDVGTSCTGTTFNLAASDTNSTNFNASTVSPASVAVAPGTSGPATLTVTAMAGQTSGTDSTSVTAGASGHTNGVSNAVTTTIGVSSAVFAVNSGGPQYTSPSSGVVYQADTDYSGGATASVTAAITGTSDPTLYQTERYGNFAYNIPLANGNYTVTLKFAETYWNAAGKRVFNVGMQGAQVISKLDIYAVAGKNAAYDVPVSVSVTNGALNITFTTVVDNAKVSAIEITPGSSVCIASAPTVSITPSSQTVTSGGNVTYSISIKNNDSGTSCTGTSFNLTASDTNSTNFNASTVSPASVAVAPGTSGPATLTVTAMAGQTSGTDSTSVTAGASGHTTGVSNAVTTTIGVSSAVFAVNSGGPKYTSPSSGIVYQADSDYSGGTSASTTAAISGTSDGTLYQTERYGNFSYNIPLADGNYNVTLKFAETYWNAAGKRVFNVSIQGKQVITGLDIYALVGKNAAYDETFPVTVINGSLAIAFATVVDNAKVSAIEIAQAASPGVGWVALNPVSVVGGNISQGSVTLSGPAPGGGAVVGLSSGNPTVATVPSTVNVAAGNTNATFNVTTYQVSSPALAIISATYGGITQADTLAVQPASQPNSADWSTFGYDLARTGFNPNESVLGVSNASNLHLLWSFDLGAVTVMEPAVALGVMINGVSTNVLYIGSEHGDFYALNADTGALIWHVNLGSQLTTCTDMPDKVFGASGTPSLDRAANLLYAAGGDGKAHALNLSTGAEASGWPVIVTNVPANEHTYGGVTVLNGKLYAEIASYCDFNKYFGRIVEIDFTQQPQVTNIWYPAGGQLVGGGIWGPGGVSIDVSNQHLFAATGNAFTTPESYLFSNSVVELSNSLDALGTNYPGLTGSDVDFGATPILFQAPGCQPMVAAKNKTGVLVVYTRGQISNGPVQRLQIADISDDAFNGDPAWNPVTNMLYIGNSSDSSSGTFFHGMVALDVQGNCTLSLAWQQTVGPNLTSTSPPIVANGVVYYGDGSGNTEFAFNAATGMQLWNSGSTITGGIYAAPSVVNGKLYVGAWDHKIYAFGP